MFLDIEINFKKEKKEMLEKCICATGALLHSAFVPVVHAEQKENEVQRSTEDTIWDRLKSVAHIK